MYEVDYYNGEPIPYSQRTFLANFNQRVGPIRLRQLRQSLECEYNAKIQADSNCISHDFVESRETFGTTTGFSWSKGDEGDFFTSPLHTFPETYPPDGFIVDLPYNKTDAEATIAELMANKWTDIQTRAIFIDVSFYNGNIEKFAFVRLIYDLVPGSGDYVPYIQTWVFSIADGSSKVVIALSVLAYLYIFVGFIVRELYEIHLASEINETETLTKRQMIGRKFLLIWSGYLKSMWNYFEWFIISIFATVVYYHARSDIWANQLELNLNSHNNFYIGAELFSSRTTSLGILSLLCLFRFLKLLQIPPRIGPVVLSIFGTIASKNVLAFGLLFFSLMWIFTLTFSLIFGSYSYGYRDIPSAFLTLFRTTLGDSDFDALGSKRIIGPILFVIFTYFITVMVLNSMFVAVISDLYMNLQERNQLAWDRFITSRLIHQKSQTKFLPQFATWGDKVALFFEKRFLKKQDTVTRIQEQATVQLSPDQCEEYDIEATAKEDLMKLDNEFSNLKTHVDTKLIELESSTKQRFESLEKLVRLNSRMDRMNQRMDHFEKQFTDIIELMTKLHKKIDHQRHEEDTSIQPPE
eukprot:TRINITY_DN4893_c0_g1_i1.p1 TRINITY_DN4893_c0_g1~~TRINITY_DN4893_c0_g1_i1.p1  ORF type:complete len:580 (-),score=108.55 TRINITY_DN4893_c0_g1_i1:74-1813(-)